MAKKKTQKKIDGPEIHCHGELLDPAKLKPHPANPAKHPEEQVKLLAKIMAGHGIRHPITVSKLSGFIVSGHCRREAAMLLGMKEYPVVKQGFKDSSEEIAVLVADNKVQELSEINGQVMADILVELDEKDYPIELTALSEVEIRDYVDGPLGTPSSEDDVVPPVPKKAKTKTGDLYILGEHRLLCGDATKAEDVEKVMAGGKADAVVTDPPYGKNVVKSGMVGANFGVAKKGRYAAISGDNVVPDIRFLLELSTQVLVWGGNYFADQLPPSGSWLVWDKRRETGIENTFADCELAWTNVGGPARVYRQLWNGMIREGEHDKREHPTQKPVALLVWCVTKTPGNILDPFLGSGTTIIAAEKLNRKCYGIEIDPGYCDVIVKRFADFQGRSDNIFRIRNRKKTQWQHSPKA